MVTQVRSIIASRREALPVGIRCKFCGSQDLVRYGKSKGLQLYLCHVCGRKGTDNKALPGMKFLPGIIDKALSLHYRGFSYSNIKHQLQQKYEIEPSRSTIYEWVIKYSKRTDVAKGGDGDE